MGRSGIARGQGAGPLSGGRDVLIHIQRVTRAAVHVEGACVGEIGQGFLLLVGIEPSDSHADVEVVARKIATLRCFAGRTPMDKTLLDVAGQCLVVSQFTLPANLLKGNRPGFAGAARPEHARPLVEALQAALEAAGIPTAAGRFGAKMAVSLVNDGPVTFLLESQQGRLVRRGGGQARV